MDNFLEIVTQKKYSGSYELAIKTSEFLQKSIQNSTAKNVKDLLSEINQIGADLRKVERTETVIENMIQRMIKLIIEECIRLQMGQNKDTRTAAQVEKNSFFQPNIKISLKHIDMKDFRDSIVLAVGELMTELETSGATIAEQSLEMIHSSEIILTIGRSKTVEMYLKYAAKNGRKFQVIVAECAPSCNGHDLAVSLAEDKIFTTVIPDSGIFSIMNRVNKVVIGAHSIMSNGGIKAVSGANSIALAAKEYSVPFIVCTGMYKLNPEFEDFDQFTFFNKFSAPQEVMPYKAAYSTKCQVVNPVFDYVPPDLISVFASNSGGMFPSFVYRLLREFYVLPHELENIQIDP